MTQQSMYDRLAREGDEWLAKRSEERKKSRYKQAVAILVPSALTLNTFLAISIYIVNTAMAINKDSLGWNIDPPLVKSVASASSLVVFCSAIAMKTVIDDIDFDRPAVSVKFGYTLYCLFLLLLELAAQGFFGVGLGIACQWLVLVLLFLLLRDFAYWQKFQKELGDFLDERMEAIKALPSDDPLAEAEPVVQKCSICQKESMYEVCLSCEQEHKGERHRVRAQILRAKQNNVPATLTLRQWLDTLRNFHWHCAYCNGPYEVLEHYVPISQGGGTTEDNCVPGCFSCNSKKSDKHPESARQAPKQQSKPKKRGN